jgi:hypothetical protein
MIVSHFTLLGSNQKLSSAAYMVEKVASNKSSLLLKIILQNTQTLKLFTMIIKTGNIYKQY